MVPFIVAYVMRKGQVQETREGAPGKLVWVADPRVKVRDLWGTQPIGVDGTEVKGVLMSMKGLLVVEERIQV